MTELFVSLGGRLLNNDTIVNIALELVDACWNTYASTACVPSLSDYPCNLLIHYTFKGPASAPKPSLSSPTTVTSPAVALQAAHNSNFTTKTAST